MSGNKVSARYSICFPFPPKEWPASEMSRSRSADKLCTRFGDFPTYNPTDFLNRRSGRKKAVIEISSDDEEGGSGQGSGAGGNGGGAAGGGRGPNDGQPPAEQNNAEEAAEKDSGDDIDDEDESQDGSGEDGSEEDGSEEEGEEASEDGEAGQEEEEIANERVLAEQWGKKQQFLQRKIASAKPKTLKNVMCQVIRHTAVTSTEFRRSDYISGKNKAHHNSLFVMKDKSLQPEDICGVLCSNQDQQEQKPLGQQSYQIGKNYMIFSRDESLQIRGCCANTKKDGADPPINAVFKHVKFKIHPLPGAPHGTQPTTHTLVVLVASRNIASEQEIFASYSNINFVMS